LRKSDHFLLEAVFIRVRERSAHSPSLFVTGDKSFFVIGDRAALRSKSFFVMGDRPR
jgi:hypothetical protein